jgi:hypothetical protein
MKHREELLNCADLPPGVYCFPSEHGMTPGKETKLEYQIQGQAELKVEGVCQDSWINVTRMGIELFENNMFDSIRIEGDGSGILVYADWNNGLFWAESLEAFRFIRVRIEARTALKCKILVEREDTEFITHRHHSGWPCVPKE